MFLHKNMMDRPPVERSQANQRIPPVGTQNDKKQTHRLYPSLPNTERYKLNHSIREELCADHHPERLLRDIQSEMPATDGDSTTKEQIALLEEQRHELLSINKKWAEEYETMMQYYKEKVRGLKALLKNDHSQIKQTCDEEEKHSASEKDLKSKMIKDSKESTRNSDVTPELLKAEQEAERLRLQNNTLTRRGQHQHEEIRRLNKALDKALQTAVPVGESSETQEEVWKHQAEVYKEDFLKERRDREKLKEKHLDLDRRFRKVHTELRTLKSKGTPLLLQPVPECTCTHRAGQPTREGRAYPPTNDQHHCQLQQHKPHS